MRGRNGEKKSMQFRKRKGSKRSYPITPRNSLYGPPDDKHIASLVEGGSVAQSRASSEDLENEFRRSKTREKKEHIYRATQEEANRLEVAAHNHNNGAQTRANLREREIIFRDSANRMHDELYH